MHIAQWFRRSIRDSAWTEFVNKLGKKRRNGGKTRRMNMKKARYKEIG